RHAIAARVMFARGFPQWFAGLARQRHEVGVAVVVAVHNHLVLEQNRGTAKTVHARKRPGTSQPPLVSLEIVSRHDHFLPVQEGEFYAETKFSEAICPRQDEQRAP